MPIRTRIDPIEKEISLKFIPTLSSEGRSKLLADFARRALSDAQAQNRSVLGVTPRHETFVDQRRTIDIDSVKPDGQVVFEFELHSEMFEYIADLLILSSPYGREGDKRPGHPGLYSRSHIMVVDGQLWPDPKQTIPPTAQEVFFANTVPYARKIERGLSNQAPTGVYQVVAAMAASRFGNLARIRFGYRSLVIGGLEAWARTTTLTGKGRRMSSRTREDWLRRQPAVTITFR